MKKQVFLIEHKDISFYFLFNRTLGIVVELREIQSSTGWDASKSVRDWRLKWKQDGNTKVFHVTTVFTDWTRRQKEAIRKLRNKIIKYFLNQEEK